MSGLVRLPATFLADRSPSGTVLVTFLALVAIHLTRTAIWFACEAIWDDES